MCQAGPGRRKLLEPTIPGGGKRSTKERPLPSDLAPRQYSPPPPSRPCQAQGAGCEGHSCSNTDAAVASTCVGLGARLPEAAEFLYAFSIVFFLCFSVRILSARRNEPTQPQGTCMSVHCAHPQHKLSPYLLLSQAESQVSAVPWTARPCAHACLHHRGRATQSTHGHVFYVKFCLLLQLMYNLFVECFELLTKGNKNIHIRFEILSKIKFKKKYML